MGRKPENAITVRLAQTFTQGLRGLSLGRQLRQAWRVLVGRQDMVIFVVLLVLVLVLSLSTENFFSRNNFSNLLRNFAWIAVAALGESLVIITGGIDLSVGAAMALASIVCAFFLVNGAPAWLAIGLGLATGGFVGWVNGLLVGRLRFAPFIVTLGTMSVARGLILGLTVGWPMRNLPDDFRWIGQDLIWAGWAIPTQTLLMIGVALVVLFLLKFTVLGTYIYTLGDSERALEVAGVDQVRLKILVYTISGLLAAVSGLMLTAWLGVAAPNAAAGYELDIVAAVIIGGVSLHGGEGGVWSVLIGAAFMQVLRNGLVMLDMAAHWQTAVIGLTILLGLLVDTWRSKSLVQEG